MTAATGVGERRYRDPVWLPKNPDFLAFEDAVVLASLAQGSLMLVSPAEAPRVIEVGVFRGAWATTLLMNSNSAKLTGIDPYPFDDGPSMRERLLEDLNSLQLGHRFTLVPDWTQAPKIETDLIHIDGLHTQPAVERDLHEAMLRLTNKGLLIVDDFRNMWFPGIGAALYPFLQESRLAMAAVTEDKANICGPEHIGH